MRLGLSRTGAVTLGVIVGLIAGSIATAGAARLITGKQIKNGTISAKDLSKAVRAEIASLPKVLQSGQTLKGNYNWIGHRTVGNWGQPVINYQVPLSFIPKKEIVAFGDKSSPNCRGTSTEPVAAPGYLCVYKSFVQTSQPFFVLVEPSKFETRDPKMGFKLFAQVEENTDYFFEGAWAVRAP